MEGHIKNVMDAFNSGDPSQIMSVVIELSGELSMAQETTIPPHFIDQLVAPLVQCLKMDGSPDIILYATICLTQILDIKPTIASRIVSIGGVVLLCQKLQNIESFELVEHIIKALDKISLENAYCVLAANALNYMAQILDFFDFTQQKNVLRIMNVIVRAIGSIQDLETYILPAIGLLSGFIKFHDSDEKSKEIMELATTLLATICEAMPRVYGTKPENFSKLRAYIEEISRGSLLDNLLDMLFIAGSSKGFSALTPRTWNNVMQIVKYLCKNSPKVCKHAISKGLLNVIQTILSTDSLVLDSGISHIEASFKEPILSLENTDIINENSISLLDSLLPCKHLLVTCTKSVSIEMLEDCATEGSKEKIFTEAGPVLIDMLLNSILPKVLQILENTSSPITKLYCLQIIDKILAICGTEKICNILTPQISAQFLYEGLSSNEPLFVCFGVRFAEFIITKLAKVHEKYIKYLKREGVIEQIKQLQEFSYLDNKFTNLPDPGWHPLNSPYIKYFLSFNSSKPEEIPQFSLAPFEAFIKNVKKPGPPSNSPKPFPTKFVDYIFQSASYIFKLVESFVESAEFKEAEQEFSICQKLSNHLEGMLRIGISGKKEEWVGIFQHIANLLISDSSFTAYESRSTRILQNLYYALCITPTEYHHKMMSKGGLEETKGESPELKLRTIMRTQREDILQLVIRHNAFMSVFMRTVQGKKSALSELIFKLHESLANIEKSIDENINLGITDQLSNPLYNPLYKTGKKLRIMAIYKPNSNELKLCDFRRVRIPDHKIPENIEKSQNAQLLEIHKIFEQIHSLTFIIEKANTIKDLEKFLKKRVKSEKDIAILKGPHYYMIAKQETELVAALGDSAALQEFLDEQEQAQENEEISYNLVDIKNMQQNEGESDNAPAVLHYEKMNISEISPKKIKENSSKISFKFYWNGTEITNKNQGIYDLILKGDNKKIEFPHDISGAISFQIYEKNNKKEPKIQKPMEISKEIPTNEEKNYLFSGLNSEEQHVVSLCRLDLNFEILQISDPHIAACLKLLKTLYLKIKTILFIDKTAIPYLSHIKDEDFINHKLEQLIKKRLQEPSLILNGSNINTWMNDWTRSICLNMPFVVNEKSRLIYYKLSILDKERAILLLMQTLKNSGFSQTKSEFKTSNKRIKLKVNRENILECGLNIMQTAPPQRNYILEFDFADEVGSGLGPTLEFYSLCANSLKSIPSIWRHLENGTLFPAPIDPLKKMNENNQKIINYFRFMGWLIARGITDERLVDLPFSDVFWDLILNKPLTINDLGRIDYKNTEFFLELERIKKKKENIERDISLDAETKKRTIETLRLTNGGKIQDLLLSFVLQGYDNIELKQNGINTVLTLDNITEYLDLTVEYTLYRTVQPQIIAFREGFNSVLPIEFLQFFKATELENLICGNKQEVWNLTMLTDSIFPVHGYDKVSPQYKYFIQYLISLTSTSQRLFLQYATGCPRLPIGGFEKLQPKMTIAKRVIPLGDNPDIYLPSVMTCQNYIKIPEYTSYEILKEKFDYALKEGQNSFTLS